MCTCSAEDIVINMPETVKSQSGASAEVLQSKKKKKCDIDSKPVPRAEAEVSEVIFAGWIKETW